MAPRPLFPGQSTAGPKAPGFLDDPWAWLTAPAYEQPSGISPEMMVQAGVPQTSRLQAIGQALMGFGQGINQSVREGRSGGLGGLASGAVGASNAFVGGQKQEQEQTMQRLLQQAQIAKLLRGDAGDTSEAERLISTLPKDQQQAARAKRLDTLMTENRPPTWQTATPEQLKGTPYPPGTQISSQGEFKAPGGEFVTSATEKENQRLRILEIQASQGNAAASRELAAAQFDALQQERKLNQENKAQDDVANLRKEFEGLSEVKSYKVQLPILKAMQGSLNDPGADLDFVYGTAKIIDPQGAVQQGDADTIRSSSTLNSLLGGYLDLIQGGSKLGPERRRQLLELATRRVQQSRTLYEGALDQYSGYAQDSGVTPGKVVRDIGPPPAFDFGAPAAPAVAAVPQGAPVPPAAAGVVGEVWGP